MKNGKWLVFLAAAFCFAVLLSPVSAAVVSPDDTFYVYDGAQVLSEETEQYIRRASQELENKTDAQIVVVTISSLEGRSLEEYATELFRQWGIGDEKKNNGVLLLCAVEDRQFRVEVGYGMEGDLPDGKTGRMQDIYIIPLLQENKFDEGIKNGYNAFLQAVAEIYDVTVTGETAVSYDNDKDDLALGICTVTGLTYTCLASIFLLKKKKPHLTAIFWIAEAVQLTVIALVLQSLITAIWIVGISLTFTLKLRVRNFRTGGSFGRGYSGGSFGSGRSGGGFRGGGGRSGGGGSSRSF